MSGVTVNLYKLFKPIIDEFDKINIEEVFLSIDDLKELESVVCEEYTRQVSYVDLLDNPFTNYISYKSDTRHGIMYLICSFSFGVTSCNSPTMITAILEGKGSDYFLRSDDNSVLSKENTELFKTFLKNAYKEKYRKYKIEEILKD